MLLVQVRGEMAVLPALTAVLLHHSSMENWTDCNVFGRGEEKWPFCLQLSVLVAAKSQCYEYMDCLQIC